MAQHNRTNGIGDHNHGCGEQATDLPLPHRSPGQSSVSARNSAANQKSGARNGQQDDPYSFSLITQDETGEEDWRRRQVADQDAFTE
jgi:hypothetical protein